MEYSGTPFFMPIILCNIKMKKKYIKYSIWGVTVFVIASVISIFICNGIIINHSKQKLYTNTTMIPVNDVGLLLGTSPKLKNGSNNLYFDYRIIAADELYKAGKIKCILISGDNHNKGYNEPEEMKNALMAKGVPEEVIYLDYAGFRTLDSVIRAKEVFGQSRITMISQKFHNERAVYLAEKNGISAIGFNAKDVDVYAGLKTQVRELFARVKMFVDLAIDKKPRFLGEKVVLELK